MSFAEIFSVTFFFGTFGGVLTLILASSALVMTTIWVLCLVSEFRDSQRLGPGQQVWRLPSHELGLDFLPFEAAPATATLQAAPQHQREIRLLTGQQREPARIAAHASDLGVDPVTLAASLFAHRMGTNRLERR